jgi:hypothetical protein
VALVNGYAEQKKGASNNREVQLSDEVQAYRRGGHDPPDTEAADEGNVNLAKQALRVRENLSKSPSAKYPTPD